MDRIFHYDKAKGCYSDGTSDFVIIPIAHQQRDDEGSERDYVKIRGANPSSHRDSSLIEVVYRNDSIRGDAMRLTQDTNELQDLRRAEEILSKMDGAGVKLALDAVRDAKAKVISESDRLDAMEARRDQALENRRKRIQQNGKNSFK